MSRVIDVIKEIYKPYRITKKGKTTILDTTSGKFITKEKGNKNIRELYNYLLSRGFDSFPKLIDGDRDEYDVFEYIDETPTPKEQKSGDLINIISNLHAKTTYHKEVSEDKYKSIYEDVSNNIVYLENYYTEVFSKINTEVYMAPSSYLLIRNSTKIMAALDFCKRELDVWYKLVAEKKKQRVAVVHNNLSTEHLIESEREYLVSWDKSTVDSPILDVVNYYKNDFHEVDFEVLIESYLNKYPLDEDELKLLFIIISIPQEIDLVENEFTNTITVKKSLDYLYKTEKLIGPYYTKDTE